MNQPVPTGPDLFAFAEASYGKARSAGSDPDNTTFGSPEEVYHFRAAMFHAVQAQTAAAVMAAELFASATGMDHDDLTAWREKIGLSWLKECRSKERRRPACAERHTEDCSYADPVPEPRHELLPIGTRVLVTDLHDNDGCTCASTQPWVGRIVGYDVFNTKYQINEEYYGRPGEYYDFVKWTFADSRVQVHPDGPDEPTPAQLVKRGPAGPRLHVQHKVDGRQGFITGAETDGTRVQVHWFGRRGSSVSTSVLLFIQEADVERCDNGQTRDDCRESDLCELCQQAADIEGDEIERSMNV